MLGNVPNWRCRWNYSNTGGGKAMSNPKYFVVYESYGTNALDIHYKHRELKNTLVEALAQKQLLEKAISEASSRLDRDKKVYVAQIVEIEDIGFYVKKKKL